MWCRPASLPFCFLQPHLISAVSSSSGLSGRVSPLYPRSCRATSGLSTALLRPPTPGKARTCRGVAATLAYGRDNRLPGLREIAWVPYRMIKKIRIRRSVDRLLQCLVS
jgi:hypothetical protein